MSPGYFEVSKEPDRSTCFCSVLLHISVSSITQGEYDAIVFFT